MNLDTMNATAKFAIAPTVPNASGEIPRNQLAATLGAISVPLTKNQPLNQKMYNRVKPIPANIPEIAPAVFMRLEKIPIINTGKMEDAAKPNAKATTSAAKPGGFIPM